MRAISKRKSITPNITSYLISATSNVHYVLQHLWIWKDLTGKEWMRRLYMKSIRYSAQHLALAEVLGLIERKEVTKNAPRSKEDQTLQKVELALGVCKNMKPGALYYKLTPTGEEARKILNDVYTPIIYYPIWERSIVNTLSKEAQIKLKAFNIGTASRIRSYQAYLPVFKKYKKGKKVRIPVKINRNRYNYFLTRGW